MVKRESMYLKILNKGISPEALVTEIFGEMRSQGRHRLPILNEEGRVVYMVHRSMISEFLAEALTESRPANTLTLENMMNRPGMREMFERTFVFVAPEVSVEEAKETLKQQAGARDVFVTPSGKSDEAVLGMLTSSDVVESM
jgi:CBS domain-containing protein